MRVLAALAVIRPARALLVILVIVLQYEFLAVHFRGIADTDLGS